MRLSPGREAFAGLFGSHRLVPVTGEALSDFLTPPMVYASLPPEAPKFLLESATGGDRWGRYSFVGSGVRVALSGSLSEGLLVEEFHEGRKTRSERVPGDLLDAFAREMDALRVFIDPGIPAFAQGAVGYLGYDMVRTFEEIPSRLPPGEGFPDLQFVVPEILIAFDHAQQKIRILTWADRQNGTPDRLYDEAAARICSFWDGLFAVRTLPKPRPSAREAPFPVLEVTDAESFKRGVEIAKEHIRAGDIFQVVLSRRFEFDWEGSPLTLYRVLRSINPSPYLYLIENGPLALVGSSPELFVRVSDRTVDLRPIAGTVRRSGDPEEDERRSRALLLDPKERAEHVMLVDLGRNDVGRVSAKGEVRVREMMVLEQYSHVIHIVSHVTGVLAKGKRGYDVIRAAHPAGTLSGAPKIRAMEIIEDLEPVRRGPYAGCVGTISFSGDVDLAIAIRSVFLNGTKGFFQAGAGIVADSDPDRENQEVLAKAQVMIRALEISHGSEGPWLF